jgi:hypothetical protein
MAVNEAASATRDVTAYREGGSPTRQGSWWAFLAAALLGLALLAILWMVGALR